MKTYTEKVAITFYKTNPFAYGVLTGDNLESLLKEYCDLTESEFLRYEEIETLPSAVYLTVKNKLGIEVEHRFDVLTHFVPRESYFRIYEEGTSNSCRMEETYNTLEEAKVYLEKEYPGIEFEPFYDVSRHVEVTIGNPHCKGLYSDELYFYIYNWVDGRRDRELHIEGLQ